MAEATPKTQWTGEIIPEAFEAISADGGLIVCATKVGYILMATDGEGLERKFDAKQRKRNKPAVVLCASIDELKELAQVNDEIIAFYERHWEQDILLGCILPWREDAIAKMPDDTVRELARDGRGTSCFVIRFGRPAEQIAAKNWEQGKVTFASSANPSGIGNRGQVAFIGERIESEADYIVAADDYVASIQPDKDEDSRHEQGVMVSLVDKDGNLVPEQKGERSITPCPVLIRNGLDGDRIMNNLSEFFLSWDYRQGEYY
ncbi:L-threonylcarbamoyladenylate synthase [Corynebacterium sp. TAE3-ERU16]|uniref:L-threonylcarbamoyladenylate synthase n=1 Tax=Corynebacterium sp. TAE3-ERU16 TaxID=2849493 RepID=UPI001C4742A0|nr:Sua5/YciO/YrdC/YwlC family protein [Corynebacterium sp. TAE3-ERU16]MBV7293681.1 Sua5/YciO/YrdC/YwlC family protein [Corynebacterium sp. TAE3-ERU16]